ARIGRASHARSTYSAPENGGNERAAGRRHSAPVPRWRRAHRGTRQRGRRVRSRRSRDRRARRAPRPPATPSVSATADTRGDRPGRRQAPRPASARRHPRTAPTPGRSMIIPIENDEPYELRPAFTVDELAEYDADLTAAPNGNGTHPEHGPGFADIAAVLDGGLDTARPGVLYRADGLGLYYPRAV